MPYHYVREPLTAEESDHLSNACETPVERLVVWALLDTGLRVGELCRLPSKNILWQPRQLRIKGKGDPAGASPGRRAVRRSARGLEARPARAEPLIETVTDLSNRGVGFKS